MEKKVIFAEGFRIDLPDQNTKDKAPWIKSKISVRVDDAIEFLKKYRNDRGFVNIDVKLSKGGSLYMELNSWKIKQEEQEQQEFIKTMQTPTPGFKEPMKIEYPEDDITELDIPF